MKIKNQDFLKKENRSLVLEIILNQGPISRAEIAKQTSMSPTSASRIVASLQENKLIREMNMSSEGIGRKATYFIPNEHSVFSIGVEIDQKVIRIGLMNFIGKLTILKYFDYQSIDPVATVQFIADHILQMIDDENLTSDQIAGVCIGLPGLIENDKGEVKLSAQFDWKNIPLQEMVEEKVGFTVFVDNELKLKALAEYISDPEPKKAYMAMIGFGSGVGSALIKKGEIYRGEGNFSGEIGHTIVDPYGIYCPCGNFGCLQTYIAEKFLLDEASKTKEIENIQALIIEYENGEKWARNIVDKAITYAAITINNVVCVYNPDSVVLAGSLIERFPQIKDQIIEKCENQMWAPVMKTFQLRTTKTGEDGVVIGAAMIVLQHFIKNIHEKSGV
ncbi:MAG: ROK family transcriptional regulator [Bacillota bacterium]|uniref:ROK family transcriptional regulator n=2 Tax=Virgibacillus TaxID=84406 RepID=A0A941I7Z5_9BACI|nr:MULTISPECIES: ROK family transcriptional regulator [Bacillaceae]NAZ07767.1 ROK family protein [Agaribacter marinus]MBR7795049.1 ROK family transcriptional regulator [Virgibacillus salarius]MCC2248446.1 ROK family transcriptional regulator [Virgibacillus sp. AGTR]MDY7043119.1 ROK family transcriptional regulator [Virgibacillus sp. M23]QRZ16688.1 ROK family transcriptional regulator [Virgibacillus sp. AGTR]